MLKRKKKTGRASGKIYVVIFDEPCENDDVVEKIALVRVCQ